MDLVSWTDDLSVGIASIDEQHKNLINMINTLNTALQDGSSREIIPQIFDGLAVYTMKHLNYEESLFKQYGYPDAKQHIIEHAELARKVMHLQGKMNGGDFMISLEVLDFLKQWLSHHVLETDMAYSKFLIEKGVE